MRLLATTDYHGNVEAVRKTAWKAKEYDVDVVVVCGDMTHFGSVEQVKDLLSILKTSQCTVMFVPGNCDPPGSAGVSDRDIECIHGKCMQVDGITFLGVGGSSPSPFDTPFELGEGEIAEILEQGYKSCQGGVAGVLVSHSPPRYTKVDTAFTGEHVGSFSVREFVERAKPRLVLCGHIHEASGTDRIGDSVVINPGPARHNRCALIELNANVNARLDSL